MEYLKKGLKEKVHEYKAHLPEAAETGPPPVDNRFSDAENEGVQRPWKVVELEKIIEKGKGNPKKAERILNLNYCDCRINSITLDSHLNDGT